VRGMVTSAVMLVKSNVAALFMTVPSRVVVGPCVAIALPALELDGDHDAKQKYDDEGVKMI